MRLTRQEEIEKVKSMKPGDECYIAWSEGGGGLVRRIPDTLILFEIPQYGGEERHTQDFSLNDVEKLVDMARSWT